MPSPLRPNRPAPHGALALLCLLLSPACGDGPGAAAAGDDPLACQARANLSLSTSVVPGRYFLVADTYVEGGTPMPGPYTLTATLE